MEFNNGTNSYAHPSFNNYLYSNQSPAYKKNEIKNKGFSIEDILMQDDNRLLDKVVNTALSVSYRLKLYQDCKCSLESKWNELSSEIGELSGFMPGDNMNVERRKSMLEKERNNLEKQLFEDRLQTWKDLNEPVSYFVDLWHKKKELKMDRRILG